MKLPPCWMACCSISLVDMLILINHAVTCIIKMGSSRKLKKHQCTFKIMLVILICLQAPLDHDMYVLLTNRVRDYLHAVCILTVEWCAPEKFASQMAEALKSMNSRNNGDLCILLFIPQVLSLSLTMISHPVALRKPWRTFLSDLQVICQHLTCGGR